MGIILHLPNTQLLMAILLIFAPTSVYISAKIPLVKPNCIDRCGNISIPFPFGTTHDCYLNTSFFVTCNETYNPPKVFLQKTSIEITKISLEGQLHALQFIARDCYSRNGTRLSYSNPWIYLPVYLTVNNTANKFTVVGCDTYAFVYGRRINRNYQTGCTAMCDNLGDLSSGSCSGLGCCQTSIPKEVWRVDVTLKSYENYTNVWDFNNCGYGFLVDQSEFRFSPRNLSSLRNVQKLPMVIDWAIGNGTCEVTQKNKSSYACKSTNSRCYKPDNGYGYRCLCSEGYQGNPYLPDGCQDVDECQDPSLSKCQKQCVNTIGGYECVCPKGYHGDGKKDGSGCIRGQSFVFKLVTGIALGIIILVLAACWLYLELKRRKFVRMKHTFFVQNGGLLLQEKLRGRDKSTDVAKIFPAAELKKATNKFHDSMIIGQGGFGTVYKGFLSDNRIVAIKKSKEVDPNQVEQFINEINVLSQINHRNVVKLLGCCLETQAPLLVYEFIDNGTLYEHIHNKTKARGLTWDKRLRVAAEAAGVLAYLHSAASPPIIHRDVKSANILLDTSFTAKVSDFGASRLVPLDQTELSTMVQGTFGYLDPEYMQTSQLTEKSDVYSFGVVLAELVTGKKVLSYERREEDRSLANYFLSTMKQGQLFQVVDNNIISEGNKEELIAVCKLAKRCLQVRGEDRPSMKEVATEVESLRLREKHPSHEANLVGEQFIGDVFPNGEGSSTRTSGYDSMRGHIILAPGGGR